MVCFALSARSTSSDTPNSKTTSLPATTHLDRRSRPALLEQMFKQRSEKQKCSLTLLRKLQVTYELVWPHDLGGSVRGAQPSIAVDLTMFYTWIHQYTG